MKFRNLSLALKIGLGSACPLVLIVIVSIITIFSLRSLTRGCPKRVIFARGF